MIYVPLESSDLTEEKANTDKELVKRLEAVVAHWTTQIGITLGDQEQTTNQHLFGLEDVQKFWSYRCEEIRKQSFLMKSIYVTYFSDDNLNCIHQQLEEFPVNNVIQILLKINSTHARQFIVSKKELKYRLVEAESNIQYLSLLKEPCKQLNACETLQDLVQCLPKIIQLIRVIWLNSAHFNTLKKIESLFKMLTNQIIMCCINLFDLKRVFSGLTRESIKMFRECTEICEEYKFIYHKVMPRSKFSVKL